jgi:hypothetical protein
MIRPLSLLCIALAAGSGLYLYQAKHHGRMLDKQIRDVREQTETTRARIEVLRAEYTLLNDPSRLAELVAVNLPVLKPTQPAQWTSMAELDKRLPPVGGEKPQAAAPEEPSLAPEEAPPVAALEPPPHGPVAEPPARAREPTVAEAPPPPQRAATPVVVPTPRPAVVVASVPKRPPPPRPVPAVTTSVATAEPPAPRPAPARVAPPPPPPSRVVHTPPPSPTADAIARIAHGAPVDPSIPVVASALGMARSMTLPAAVAPASAASLPPSGGGR